MSPQNINLHYRSSFAIIPSRYRRTIWANHPRKILGTTSFRIKSRMRGAFCILTLSSKISNLVISRRCYAEYRTNLCKNACVPHVQHDYFGSFLTNDIIVLWRCRCRRRRRFLNCRMVLHLPVRFSAGVSRRLKCEMHDLHCKAY